GLAGNAHRLKKAVGAVDRCNEVLVPSTRGHPPSVVVGDPDGSVTIHPDSGLELLGLFGAGRIDELEWGPGRAAIIGPYEGDPRPVGSELRPSQVDAVAVRFGRVDRHSGVGPKPDIGIRSVESRER